MKLHNIQKTIKSKLSSLITQKKCSSFSEYLCFSQYEGATEQGLVRGNNEDSFLLDAAHGLCIVADGMGGHNDGDVASRMAVGKISEYITDYLQSGKQSQSPKNVLRNAFTAANNAIHQTTPKVQQHKHMGATCIAAWFFNNRCYIAHVGDVRGYYFRDDNMTQITSDHTVVAMMVEAGRLTQEEAKQSPFRHRVEKALGPFAQIEPEINVCEVKGGDRFLLCSDGLWDMVEDTLISDALKSLSGKGANTGKVCQQLITLALKAGGKDNVTTIFVEIGFSNF